MIQHLWVPGPLPGLNEIIAAAHRRKGKFSQYDVMKRTWGFDIGIMIKQTKLVPVAQATLHFVWYELHRRRDPDNIAVGKKFILDALTVGGIIGNDGWGQILGFHDLWFVIPEKPGVSVEIRSP